MSGHFLDSSAVAKFYHPEVGSTAIERMLGDPACSVLISRLAVVEVQSAFAGKVRAGVISPGDAENLRRRFLEDIASGTFQVVALASAHLEWAGELIERHGATCGLRTLDSIQAAVALDLHRAGIVEDLVPADKVLCKVAAAEGMPVTDPEAAAL